MALENRFKVFEETGEAMETNYKTSRSKIQTVPSYLREREKYEKYYSPKLISIGPIHHGDPKLKKGEQYKLMWAWMYAKASRQTPQLLHKRIVDHFKELRGLFSWDEIGLALERDVPYNDEDLAWMLFVDGCAVLHILENGNLSKQADWKIKVDIPVLALVHRDLFLLENQLPYRLLELLSEDAVRLKESMHGFCGLQNMFTLVKSRISLLFREPEVQIEIVKQNSPPTHLLDCLRTSILSSEVTDEEKIHPSAGSMHGFCGLQNMFRLVKSPLSLLFREPEDPIEIVEQSSPPTDLLNCLRTSILSRGMKSIHQDHVREVTDKEKIHEPIEIKFIIHAALQFREKDTTHRNIQELKAAAIRVKRQKNISLKNISFSSSFFGGKLHLTPLILDDSTVPTLLNLVAYEMCPDFINELEISSYMKLLDLLIDIPEDVKELRSSGILHNSLGSDEEVVELFNTISSGLVHNPSSYFQIRKEMEKHYKNRFSIWMADAYYTYFKSPWTILAFLAALLALVLTALQTWQGFKSK